MSKKRQAGIFDGLGDARTAVVTFARDYPAGHQIPAHFHDRDQLVYASGGVMTVMTDDGTWVVPTFRAVWIPAMTAHTIAMSGAVAMRTLYFKARLVRVLPRTCCVLSVSSLLKELILHASTYPALRAGNRTQKHLIDILVDNLQGMQAVPLQVSRPRDPRALRIAEALFATPGDRRSLSQLCIMAGVSKRTAERLFQDEVGTTFGRWRQQLRLMQAMRLLAEGAKVTHAAMEAGYSTPSSFIAMFRNALGTTPTVYFREPQAKP
ncbi:MAG TPA: helix-turn-helix transcriptional regulator [Steroidobacteraceae bacterium]|nr:helix-turn-helix transcriptional regulator [Steroidobacteraceae bacterium]